MRDVFAQMPDSIFPLLTLNNRLDCIDFIENNMEARVKNRLEEQVTLESLTDDYMRLRTSDNSYTEIKLVPQAEDTVICLNRTCQGPIEDSNVTLYNMQWKKVGNVERPSVADFLNDNNSGTLSSDTLQQVKQEALFLPLIKASLSPDTDEISWTLQTGEFSKDLKKVATKYLRPVIVKIAKYL
jgi:hypothetical protein